MTNERETLPIDSDDYSLPGRILDSNSFYQPAPTPRPKSKGLWIGIIAFVIFSVGFYSFYFANQEQIDSQILQNTLPDPEQRLAEKYNIGEYGSAHEHAAFALFIDGHKVNFGHPKYQLTSKYIHFENHNPYLIHKHAKGAPLEMLFSSFGLQITSDCIVMYQELEEINRFCSANNRSLMAFVNNERSFDIGTYEIKHGDRILVTLGNDEHIEEQLAYLDSLKIFDVPKKTPQYYDDEISI